MRKYIKIVFNIMVSLFAVIGGIVCIGALWLAIDFRMNSSLSKEDLMIVDCGWDDTASTWIDENKDGVWNSNEKPLAGVRFIADNVNIDDYLPDDSFSDENGKARLSVFPLDCNMDNAKIILYAIPPDNYKSTTSWRIIVPREALNNVKNNDFQFGFVLEEK